MSVRLHTMTVGPIATNCYILSTDEYPEKAVVIDPGDEADAIEDWLKELHLEPCAILLTHGHYDHILAVNPLKQQWPECEILISEDERNMVEDPSLNCQFGFPDMSIHPDRYVSDGEHLTYAGMEFIVIKSPGHTAGSVCYYLEKEGILFSGDTLFRRGFGRTDLPTGNYEDLLRSLVMLLQTLPPETVVYPGHGLNTLIREEKRLHGL